MNKHAITEAGKDQTKVTEGWKVLVLDKRWQCEFSLTGKEKGFMTFHEEMPDDKQRRVADEIAEREAAAEIWWQSLRMMKTRKRATVMKSETLIVQY